MNPQAHRSTEELKTIVKALSKLSLRTLSSNHLLIMSTLHHEDMLLQIFDEVQEAFPYLDEEKQIEIANNRFQELCQ